MWSLIDFFILFGFLVIFIGIALVVGAARLLLKDVLDPDEYADINHISESSQ